MLGTVDQTYLFRVLEAVAAADAPAAIAVADELEMRSTSFDGALGELATLLHRVALAQASPAALADDLPERERIVALAAALDAESVQLYYQIAIQSRQDLPLAPDEYAGFSMALMRMLAFAPEGAAAAPRSAPANAASCACIGFSCRCGSRRSGTGRHQQCGALRASGVARAGRKPGTDSDSCTGRGRRCVFGRDFRWRLARARSSPSARRPREATRRTMRTRIPYRQPLRSRTAR